MITKEEIIFGNKFRNLDNGFNIFYRDIHEVNDFFVNCNKEIPFILISHNSDGSVTDNPTRFNVGSSNDADSRLIPDNLVCWYTQNVKVKHSKIKSIPIGMENDIWFPEINKIEKIINKINEEKTYINDVYMCFNINNNFSERNYLFNLLNNKSFVTSEIGYNGNNDLFNRFLNNIYNHKFVVCPEGNGIDTHRTWETLYLGSIPIEKRNFNNIYYENKLPICFVNDWNEINEDFLEKEYNRIKNTDYNLDLLNFNYWKNKIENTI